MTHAFRPFPSFDDGPRKTGIEIEFSGLDEETCAGIIQDHLGGITKPVAAHVYEVLRTSLGTIRVELDIFLAKREGGKLLEEGLNAARSVVPVEIITEPLTPSQVKSLDELRDALRRSGAEGSSQGMFLGFGVHLNPALSGNLEHDCRTVLSYALLEDHLRESFPIDTTRRLLPFVDPWPNDLVDALAEKRPETWGEIMRLYAEHTTSRNHGLDLLPVFKDADEEAFDGLFTGTDGHVSGRPAYHVRLPDSRIDEEGWSLHEAWEMWHLVEDTAQDAALLEALCEDRKAHAGRLMATRSTWAETVKARLDEAAVRGAA